ncbi:hypothetical protein CSUI_005273 [Cystoisospora suis]|uniref:Uncharacterized protein n=1 Tax=Cystoisospora suis TaxID=483139 RepID=A0A2C6KY91_9APIC|nr:hypothetical protein CSUI_005273 [Cystoisospora suis]
MIHLRKRAWHIPLCYALSGAPRQESGGVKLPMMYTTVAFSRVLRPSFAPGSTRSLSHQKLCSAFAQASCVSSADGRYFSFLRRPHHLCSLFSASANHLCSVPSTSHAKCQHFRTVTVPPSASYHRYRSVCDCGRDSSFLSDYATYVYPAFCSSSARRLTGTGSSLRGRQRREGWVADASLQRLFLSSTSRKGSSLAGRGPRDSTLGVASQTVPVHGQGETRGSDEEAKKREEKAGQATSIRRGASQPGILSMDFSSSMPMTSKGQKMACVPAVGGPDNSQGKDGTEECSVSSISSRCSSSAGTQRSSSALLVPDVGGPSHENPVKANGSEDDQQGRKWSFWQICCFSFGIGVAGVAAYLIHDCDYNVAKAEWVAAERIGNLFFKRSREGPRQEAANRSKFSVGLSPELQKELALFFLQLDLDKPNGVRRSDIMDFIGKLGFSTTSNACKSFLESGKGRTLDKKRVSGVTLQEFAAFVEDLLLEEELSGAKEAEDSARKAVEQGAIGASETNTNDVLSKDQGDDSSRESFAHSEEDAGVEDRKRIPDKTLPEGEAQGREKPADRILRHLRTLNKSTVLPDTIPSCYTEPSELVTPDRSPGNVSSDSAARAVPSDGPLGKDTSRGGDVAPSAELGVEATELELLRLHLDQTVKVVKNLATLKSRRGLSEAELARFEALKAEATALQHDIWRLEKDISGASV